MTVDEYTCNICTCVNELTDVCYIKFGCDKFDCFWTNKIEAKCCSKYNCSRINFYIIENFLKMKSIDIFLIIFIVIILLILIILIKRLVKFYHVKQRYINGRLWRIRFQRRRKSDYL